MMFKNDIAVNLNDEVKVKLTREAIQELARQHKSLREQLLESGSRDIGEFVLILDDKGYYKTQLWSLMDKFSEYMGLGAKVMFEGGNIYVIAIANPRGE